jgi:hypothetical protein
VNTLEFTKRGFSRITTKFATAFRLRMANADSITRRFTKNNVQHPTYKALCDLGKALKILFLCDYLCLELLRREIHKRLQVIENWNSTNDFILLARGEEFGQQSVGELRACDAVNAATSGRFGLFEQAHDPAGTRGVGLALSPRKWQ